MKTNTIAILLILSLFAACTFSPQAKPTQVVSLRTTATEPPLPGLKTETATQPAPTPTSTPLPINAKVINDLQILSPGNGQYLAQVADLWPADLIVSGVDFYSGQDLLVLGTGKYYSYNSFSPFESFAMAEGTRLVFWDPLANTQQDIIETETRLDPNDINTFKYYKNVAVSPDGQWVVLVGNDRMLLGSKTTDTTGSVPQFSHQEILYDDFENPNPDAGAAFSPDSRLLAIANGNEDIQVWDMQNKQTIATFSNGEPNGPPEDFFDCYGYEKSGITFTPDSAMLLSMCGQNLVAWDLNSGKRSQISNFNNNVRVFALNPNGSIVVTGDGTGTMSIWKYPSWEAETQLHSFHQEITGLAFNLDGSLLACSSSDGKVDLWDTTTWTRVTSVEAAADFLKFSPDGRYLVIGMYIKGGTLWGVKAGSLAEKTEPDLAQLSLPVRANITGNFDSLTAENASWVEHITELWPASLGVTQFGLAGSQPGPSDFDYSFFFIYSTNDEKKLVLWDPQSDTGTELMSNQDPAIHFHQMAVSPDGLWVALTNDNLLILGRVSSNGPDGKPAFTTQELPTDELTESNPLTTRLWLAFSHASHLLAIVNGEGKILLWDLRTNQKAAATAKILDSEDSYCHADDRSLSFTPGDTALIFACKTNIYSLDLTTYTSRQVLNNLGDGSVFALSPSGKYLAVAGLGKSSILVKGFPSGAQQARLAGHDLFIINLFFSPDESLLASSSKDGTFSLWDTHTWKRLASLQGGTILGFTPDSKFLITWPGVLWGVRTGSSASIRSGIRIIHVDNGEDLALWENAIPQEWLAGAGSFPRVSRFASLPTGVKSRIVPIFQITT